MDHHAKLNYMRDVLDHLRQSHEQWQFADSRTSRYLADSIQRDLDECRRLCESIRGESRLSHEARSPAYA